MEPSNSDSDEEIIRSNLPISSRKMMDHPTTSQQGETTDMSLESTMKFLLEGMRDLRMDIRTELKTIQAVQRDHDGALKAVVERMHQLEATTSILMKRDERKGAEQNVSDTSRRSQHPTFDFDPTSDGYQGKEAHPSVDPEERMNRNQNEAAFTSYAFSREDARKTPVPDPRKPQVEREEREDSEHRDNPVKHENMIPPQVQKIIVQRERHHPSFSGGPTVDDWIRQTNEYLQENDVQDKPKFILQHLVGLARMEIQNRPWHEVTEAEDIFQILRELFRESRDLPSLQMELYQRKQRPKESLLEYSVALVECASAVERQPVGKLSDRNGILKRLFAKGILDSQMSREASRRLIDHPEESFYEMRAKLLTFHHETSNHGKKESDRSVKISSQTKAENDEKEQELVCIRPNEIRNAEEIRYVEFLEQRIETLESKIRRMEVQGDPKPWFNGNYRQGRSNWDERRPKSRFQPRYPANFGNRRKQWQWQPRQSNYQSNRRNPRHDGTAQHCYGCGQDSHNISRCLHRCWKCQRGRPHNISSCWYRNQYFPKQEEPNRQRIPETPRHSEPQNCAETPKPREVNESRPRNGRYRRQSGNSSCADEERGNATCPNQGNFRDPWGQQNFGPQGNQMQNVRSRSLQVQTPRQKTWTIYRTGERRRSDRHPY